MDSKGKVTTQGCNSNCRLVIVACGMNQEALLTISKADYLALAGQKYTT